MRSRWGFVAVGLGLLAWQGCSGKTIKRGEIVVAIQTDMSLPKDVDLVGIQVESFGNIQMANEYQVGPNDLHIPATLAVVAGKDPSQPVTIRVWARQNGKIRTLREVVTTVPTDRVAALSMPVQWLCDDSGKDDPSCTP